MTIKKNLGVTLMTFGATLALGLGVSSQVHADTQVNANTIKVTQGDTLGAIAKEHDTTVASLANTNGLANENLIYVGDQLTLPTTGTYQVTASVPHKNTTNSTYKMPTSGNASNSVSTSNSSSNTTETTSGSQTSSTPSSVATPTSTPSSVATPTSTTTASTSTVSAEQSAKDWIAQKESGGSYTASNPSGAYGRYQLKSYNLKWGTSAEAQERAAAAYINSKYGTWVNAKAFWMQHGWY